MTEEEAREFLFKVLVVGDVGVGKTSIIRRHVHDIFSPHYKITIGVDFALKLVKPDDNTTVRIQFWDIAGQERFGNMTRVYYKEAVGAFLVFDITRSFTFDVVKKWKADIDQKVTLKNEQPIPVVLIGNKIDLFEKNNWSKTDAEMDTFCQEYGFIGWFYTSAKDNTQIDAASAKLIKELMEKVDNKEEIVDPYVKPPYVDFNVLEKNTSYTLCNC